MFRSALCSFGLALLLLATPMVRADESVTVFAAASTGAALEEMKLPLAMRGITLQLVLDSSSTLARQILAGAPADIFLSANPQWMDEVERAGLIAEGSRRDLLANRLVLVAPAGLVPDLSIGDAGWIDRLGPNDRLVTGDPGHVPLGIYARAALESTGLWPLLQSHLAFVGNAREVVAFLETDNAVAGVVYQSDLALFSESLDWMLFNETSHPPIRYSLAQVNAANPAAAAVYDYLFSPDASAVFIAFGFEPLERTP